MKNISIILLIILFGLGAYFFGFSNENNQETDDRWHGIFYPKGCMDFSECGDGWIVSEEKFQSLNECEEWGKYTKGARDEFGFITSNDRILCGSGCLAGDKIELSGCDEKIYF